MDKIDLLILSIIVTVMVLCFSFATKWSYFCAGICAAYVVVVLVGRMAHLANGKNAEGQWEKFIDNMDTHHSANPKLAEAA